VAKNKFVGGNTKPDMKNIGMKGKPQNAGSEKNFNPVSADTPVNKAKRK
jgi:hypothetical protein